MQVELAGAGLVCNLRNVNAARAEIPFSQPGAFLFVGNASQRGKLVGSFRVRVNVLDKAERWTDRQVLLMSLQFAKKDSSAVLFGEIWRCLAPILLSEAG